MVIRLLTLALWLVPVPSFATLYDLLTFGTVDRTTITANGVTWQTAATPINAFGPTPVVYPATLPFNEARVWTVTPTHTQLATLSGVILLDGLTTSYHLDGPGFLATFTQATIAPALIGGITSSDWHGTLSASLVVGARPQDDWHWELRAATEMPEPSTLLLLAPLLLGLFLARHRHREGPTTFV